MEPTMTSAASATSIHKPRRAFTLIELLVVIGIIVLVVAIAIPMTMKAYRAGERARTQGDLTTITVAIEAFKGDFGDIPRPDAPGMNTGFACLGRFLIGPFGKDLSNFSNATSPFHPGECYYTGTYPNGTPYVCVNASTSPPPSGSDWQQFDFTDGKEGPGIKKKIGGRVYGPYLQPDKFKVQGLSLLDRQGNPILYFPGSAGHPNIHQPGGYLGIGTTTTSMYNIDDNEIFFRVSGETVNTHSRQSIAMVLGDLTNNGQIEEGETEAATAPYLLWSAGPDGIYGPVRAANTDLTPDKVNSKYDDVTNFR